MRSRQIGYSNRLYNIRKIEELKNIRRLMGRVTRCLILAFPEVRKLGYKLNSGLNISVWKSYLGHIYCTLLKKR